MRRFASYMTALVLMAAAGCTVDQRNEYDPQMQVMFHPVMEVAAKADASVEDYPAGQPFAVSAWTLESGNKWAEKASEAKEYISNERASFSEERGWTLESGELWPEKGLEMTVIGYSPVEAFSGCTAEAGAACTYDMLTSQADLLYSEPQADMDKVDRHGVVVLPFKHALAQVDFRVKNRVFKEEEIIIKSIRIDEVKHRGSFTSLPQPGWVIEDAETSLLFFEGEQATRNVSAPIGRSWNVIPQALSTRVTVEYEYRTAANTGFTLTLKTCDLETNLKPGRHYTYTLSVGIDDVKFLLEIIEDKFVHED